MPQHSVLVRILVQLGTAFLFCDKASIAPADRQQLLNAKGHHTKLPQAFSGKFARGIEYQFMREIADEATLAYPMRRIAHSSMHDLPMAAVRG